MTEKLKRPLEMIAEWRKGCSIAGPLLGKDDSPAECVECTEALIEYLEKRLRQDDAQHRRIRLILNEVGFAATFSEKGRAEAHELRDYLDALIEPEPKVETGWTLELAGTVDVNGNIVGSERDKSVSGGTVWVANEQEACQAELYGWQRTGPTTAGGLVQMTRP